MYVLIVGAGKVGWNLARELLDKGHEGRLTLQELEALKPMIPADGKFPKHRDKNLDTRVGVPLPPGGRESN